MKFRNIFKSVKNYKHKDIKNVVVDLDDEENKWYEINNNDIPNDVLLVACYTYDCGWVVDSGWYNVDKKCWMNTGTLKSHKLYLPYTHFRKMVEPPNDKKYEKFD